MKQGVPPSDFPLPMGLAVPALVLQELPVDRKDHPVQRHVSDGLEGYVKVFPLGSEGPDDPNVALALPAARQRLVTSGAVATDTRHTSYLPSVRVKDLHPFAQ